MTRTLRRATPMLGLVAPALVALSSAVAHAQKPQQQAAPSGPTCDVDQNKPGSLTKAVFTITRVQQIADTAAKEKALREAVAAIYGDASAAKTNPLGTAYTLGQAFALLAADVKLANGATRGDVGLPGTATEPVDLLKLVDSTLAVVEQAKPACAENAAQLRQYAWLNTMNKGLSALNAQQQDSAKFFASRSLIVYKKSPLPHYILGTTALLGKDYAGAVGHYEQTLALVGTDSTMKDVKAAAEQNLAAARAGEADAVAKSGNYAALLADPNKFGDLTLTQVGVNASQANKHADAAKLFEAALGINRFQRDALNNLAATYMQLKQYQPMLPVAQRLLEIDPANPDNYLFIAIAYQGMMNAPGVTPAAKKAYTDSLIKYNRISNELPQKVTFTEFTRGAEKASLAITVENLQKAATPAARTGAAKPAAAKPAAAAPKSYTLQMEFLDKGGAVVDSKTVTVGPVAPGQTGTTRVDVDKPGVVAFRYKIQG